MSIVTKLFSIAVLLSIWKQITSEDTCPIPKQVSIYNIESGVVILSHNGWFLYYTHTACLSTSKSDKANWYLQYVDGYVAFRNVEYSKLCLTYEGRDKYLALKNCKLSCKFELIPTLSGGSLIKVKGLNQCVYPSGQYAYTGNCPVGSAVEGKWLWAINPPYTTKSSKLNYYYYLMIQ